MIYMNCYMLKKESTSAAAKEKYCAVRISCMAEVYENGK